jgi:steroid delta-isomerase-like uncharacterized protein
LVKVLDAWATAWTSHDIDKVLALFTDDCIYEDVAMGVVNKGQKQLRDFGSNYFATFPDVVLTLQTRFVAGSFGSAEWLMKGTQKGDMPGMPASNKVMSVRGATVYEFQGDKIKRNSDYWDIATMLKQLGFMPAS